MQRRCLRGFLAIILLVVLVDPVFAADPCPVSDAAVSKAGGMAAAVTAAVTDEFSCEGAYRVFEQCQFGSTADNALSDIVLAKCEPRFLPRATPAVKAAYDKARGKCAATAAGKQGTLALGQAAVCVARAGRDFAAKYGRGR